MAGVFRNEAVTWDRLSRAHQPPRAMESALEGVLSFATGKRSRISVEGQRIQALVSGRKRTDNTAWEVDTLLATDDELAAAPGPAGATGGGSVPGGGRAGVPSPHGGQPCSARGGTCRVHPVPEGTLVHARRPRPRDGWGRKRPRRGCARAAATTRERCSGSTVSARRSRDRALEAATLNQWHAARERDGCCDHGEFVVEERDGRLSAWIRVARDGRISRMMVMALQPECCVERGGGSGGIAAAAGAAGCAGAAYRAGARARQWRRPRPGIAGVHGGANLHGAGAAPGADRTDTGAATQLCSHAAG